MKPLLIIIILFSTNSFAQTTTQFDIVVGAKNSFPENLYTTNDYIYFYAIDSNNLNRLHRIDKSDSITIVSKQPKAISRNQSDQRNIIEINSKIYFNAIDSTANAPSYLKDRVWEFNNGNYKQLKKIKNGINAGLPSHYTHLGDQLYYWGTDSDYVAPKHQLFAYNIANDTIIQLTYFKNTYYGAGQTTLQNLNSIKGKIVLIKRVDTSTHAAHMGIFAYDTANKQVETLKYNSAKYTPLTPAFLKEQNGSIYFISYDTALNYYLSKYDGISDTIQIVDTIQAGSVSYGMKNTTPVMYKGEMYMQGYNKISGNTMLAKYNPTTNKVSYMPYNIYNKRLDEMIIYHNKLYFTSSGDRSLYEESYLFEYDGIDTPKLVNINIERVRDLTVFNGYLYFSGKVNNNTGVELFKYTDTATTSIIAKNKPEKNIIAYPNPVKNVLNIQLDLKQSKTLSVTLTDMQGKVVYRSQPLLYSKAKHTITIPVNGISPGIYNYYINTGNYILYSGKINKL